MVDISRRTYERNGIKTIADNNRILCLNKTHIEEGLDHKILWSITIKYHLKRRKHKPELDNKKTMQ